MLIELETFRLVSGTKYVRPKNSLGTCGFYPKAWQIAVVKRGKTAEASFLEANPNWHAQED